MPTYAYACRECGHRFEVVQSFSDDSLTICPECDGSLRKVFNSVGVVFKGSGFYRTDSRSNSSSSSSSTTPAAKDKKGDTSSSSSSSSSSDTGSSTPAPSAPSTPAPKSD